jgi:hypothetical protein
MKNNLLIPFLVGLTLVFTFGCVTEFDFRTEPGGVPGVSGVISNSPAQRTLTVFRTNGIDESQPLSATGALYADGAFEVQLVEVEPGRLELPISYQLRTGVEYHFEITTVENQVFQTIPQKILPFTKKQTLSWERDEEVFPNPRDPDEVVLPRKVVNIFTNLEIDENEDSVYFYRWQVSNTYLVQEIPRPFVDTFMVIDSQRDFFTGGWVYDTSIIFTPDTAKSCYPTEEVDQYPSTLLETSNLQPGIAKVKLMTREIDQAFLFKHYFSVFLHRIDAAAYDYYARAERLIGNQGTLYDEVPAPLTGNVFDKNDPEANVLGYVEMAFPDTVRIAIIKEDLNLVIEDGCRPRGGGPIACRELTSPSGAPPPPCKCYDCDKVFGLETDEKPDYWE